VHAGCRALFADFLKSDENNEKSADADKLFHTISLSYHKMQEESRASLVFFASFPRILQKSS
jgi:hypothetical protein